MTGLDESDVSLAQLFPEIDIAVVQQDFPSRDKVVDAFFFSKSNISGDCDDEVRMLFAETEQQCCLMVRIIISKA